MKLFLFLAMFGLVLTTVEGTWSRQTCSNKHFERGDWFRPKKCAISEPAGSVTVTIMLENNVSENLGDAQVRDGIGLNTNAGTATNALIGFLSSSNYGAYLKYNISAIPAGATIDSATLYVFNYQTIRDIGMNIYQVKKWTWVETEITMANGPCGQFLNNATNCNLSSMAWTNFTTGETWYGINVLPAVRDEYQKGNSTVGLYIYNKTTRYGATDAYFRIYTKEYVNVTVRPYLNITYTT